MVRLFEIALNGFGAESSEILNFGTWGSYGNQYIHITPDENWEGLVITAYFRLDNEPVGSCLFGEDMTIDIPPEATAKPTSGSVKGKVTFRGTQDGRVIITTDLPYFVLNHSDTEESDNKYTPDQWSQFVSQVDASRKAAEAASAQASKSAAQAAQSLSDAKQVESNVIYQGSTAVQTIQESLSYVTASINAQTNQSLSAIQSKQDEAVAAISKQVGDAQKSAYLAAQYASNAEASANAAAENANKVQQEVESGISAIGDATESAKSEIQTAKTAAVDAVNQTKTQAVSSVITQQNSSIQAVQAAQNTAVQAVQTAQTEGVKAVNDAGDAKIKEIEAVNAIVPTPTPEDAGKVVVVKPDGTGYELGDAGSEIDDTVVDSDTTWSSLNIVNKLCPPFSVTGDAVQFTPIEGYPLSVQSTIVATQEGTGDPSPTNVRPIVPVEQVGVWVGGKNLLYFGSENKSVTTNGVTVNYDAETQSVSISGENELSSAFIAISFPIEIFPDTVEQLLTIAKNVPDNVYTQFTYNARDGAVKALAFSVSGGTVSFNIPDDFKSIKQFQIGVNSNFSLSTPYSMTFQLEVGSAATSYEPYRGQRYTAQLDEPCYGGEIDLTEGTLSVEAGVIVLPFSEMNNSEDSPGWTNQKWVSDYVANPNQDTSFLSAGAYVADNIGWGKNLRFNPYGTVYFIKSAVGDMTQSEIQQQYPDLSLQIVLKRVTPVKTKIAPLSIPAPASPATAYSTAGEITVSGRSDPTALIHQMQEQIAALQSATIGG